jgi:hypothetical protein
MDDPREIIGIPYDLRQPHRYCRLLDYAQVLQLETNQRTNKLTVLFYTEKQLLPRTVQAARNKGIGQFNRRKVIFGNNLRNITRFEIIFDVSSFAQAE